MKDMMTSIQPSITRMQNIIYDGFVSYKIESIVKDNIYWPTYDQLDDLDLIMNDHYECGNHDRD